MTTAKVFININYASKLSLALALISLVCMASTWSFAKPAQASNAGLSTIIRKSDLNLDTSMIVQTDNYAEPKSILVTPIFINSDINIPQRDWYKGLFYYLSSQRYNFADIPAHYVLGSDGSIYEGISSGVETKIAVENVDSSPILIFYLAQRGSTDFSADAQPALQNLLQLLANENAVKAENITISGMKLAIDKEASQVKLQTEEIYGSWKLTFSKIATEVGNLYQPSGKRYALELLEFNNPTAPVKIGSEVVLKAKLKNTGSNTIFADGNSGLLLTTVNGADSQLFLNNVWLSKSQLALLPSGTVFRPNEEKVAEFKVKVPLSVGAVTQEFLVKTEAGQEIAGVRLNVNLTLDRNGVNILEVVNTEGGTLNIRQEPRANAAIVSKASQGNRYIWTERSDGGWYKINYEGGASGWVLGRYIKVL